MKGLGLTVTGKEMVVVPAYISNLGPTYTTHAFYGSGIAVAADIML